MSRTKNLLDRYVPIYSDEEIANELLTKVAEVKASPTHNVRERRISFDEFIQFIKYWDTGKYNSLRLGQAFLNEATTDIVNPELYYMTNYAEARNYIFKHYVDF